MSYTRVHPDCQIVSHFARIGDNETSPIIVGITGEMQFVLVGVSAGASVGTIIYVSIIILIMFCFLTRVICIVEDK